MSICTCRPGSAGFNTWVMPLPTFLPPSSFKHSCPRADCMHEGSLHLPALSCLLEWGSRWVLELAEQKETVFGHSNFICYSNSLSSQVKNTRLKRSVILPDQACMPFKDEMDYWTVQAPLHSNNACCSIQNCCSGFTLLRTSSLRETA